jgi:hypothetical protein
VGSPPSSSRFSATDRLTLVEGEEMRIGGRKRLKI